MKNKFIQVLNFLRAYKKNLIHLNFYSDYEGAHWNDPYSNVRQLPSAILNVIVEIVEKYENKLYDNTSSDTDYYEIKVLIYPFEQKIVLNIFQEEFDFQDSNYKKNLPEDSFILNFMKKFNINDLNTQNGKLKYTTSLTTKPMNKNFLLAKLGDFFKDIEKSEKVTSYIFENRDKEEKVRLKRVIERKKLNI